MPLRTEVNFGPGDVVLDGIAAPPKRGTAPQFSAHVYCGHGRRSQLLLSSCDLSYCCALVNIFGLHTQKVWGRKSPEGFRGEAAVEVWE